MIENGAKTIHVAVPPHFTALSAGLLRRHKVRRPEHLASDGNAGVTIEAFGQAKIRDARFIVSVHQDVRRLEIAVQDALAMRVVNGFGDELDVTRGSGGRQRPGAD
jgi:hypothetical protein